MNQAHAVGSGKWEAGRGGGGLLGLSFRIFAASEQNNCRKAVMMLSDPKRECSDPQD